ASKRFSEDKSAAGDVFGRSIFVGPVAPSIATRDEKHRRGSDAAHKERVVVGATSHGKELEIVRSAGVGQGLDDNWRAVGGGVRVEKIGSNRNSPSGGEGALGVGDFSQDGIAPDKVGVADIEAKADPAGDTVDGAGKNLTDADGADRIGRVSRTGGGFDGKHEFGGGTQGVRAFGHQHAASMAARAFYENFSAGRRGNFCDDAERDFPLFKNGTLLDVQFDEGLVVAGREFHGGELAREIGGAANRIK